MAKSAKKSAPVRSQGPVSAVKPLDTAKKAKAAKPMSAASGLPGAAAKASDSDGTSKPSKQSRVLSMLQSPAGATIAQMIEATGWQQHSVRGFLAGVVRKRLKLKLTSKKVDGTRIYQLANGGDAKAHSRQPKRRAD